MFDLPQEILVTLHRKDASLPLTRSDGTPSHDNKPTGEDNRVDRVIAASTTCTLCDVRFSTVAEQRVHIRSDFHGYNLKQRLRGLQTVSETDFDKLVGGMKQIGVGSI